MSELVTLTEAAENHIQEMLTKHSGGIGFRLSIKKTGCSGYAYLPAIIESVNAADIHFVATNGLPVYVDPACSTLLDGLVIDYVEDNHAGIKQKRLVYINPNEKNRCGCGESFTI
jgi:iron-sulfur cluster assembly protein